MRLFRRTGTMNQAHNAHPPSPSLSGRLDSAVRALARRMASTVAVIGAVMLAAYVAAMFLLPRSSGQIVIGDAKHHFVQLRSIVFDRDVDFRNDYAAQYGIPADAPSGWWLYDDPTPTGLVRNYMPVGPALLWAPLYIAVAGIQAGLAGIGVASAPTGYEPWLQIVPGITGVIAATLATWISWLVARRFTSAPAAAVGTLAVWLGSQALYYSLISPAYSHSASMLMTSLFCAYWFVPDARPSVRRAAAGGALVGLCALMRWQDALLLGLPLASALSWNVSWRQRATSAAVTLAGALLTFLPQMLVWNALYGTPLTVPQGPSFMQWTQPHLFAILFSHNHGLFSWTPVLALATYGLIVFAWRHRIWAPTILTVVAVSWYVNAAVADWWGGEAFGARRFLSLYPFFVLGAATWLQGPSGSDLRPKRAATAVVLVALNLLLLLQYQLFMKGLHDVAPYPYGWFDLWLARFIVPLRLLGWWSA